MALLKKLTTRAGMFVMFCALLLGLSACRKDVVISPNPKRRTRVQSVSASA